MPLRAKKSLNKKKRTYTIASDGGDGNYVCDGNADQDTINLALTENPGQKFIILSGDYSINNPITPLSNQEIIIQGTITQANKVTSLLTGNANKDQAVASVTDGSLFHEGQYLGILDPTLTVLIESAGKSLPRGEAGKIIDITGNNITFESNLSQDYTLAGGSYVTTCHSTFLLDTIYNTSITGIGGSINNDKSNQVEFEPLNLGGLGENIKVACGISVKSCENITINNLNISNAMLHNIFNYLSSNIKITGNTCTAPYFKNIGNWLCSQGSILNNTCTNSSYEDGIILYTGNTNFFINNNTCTGNKRSAIYINTNNTNITMNRNYSQNTGTNYGVYVLGTNITGNNNTYYSPVSHGCIKISGTNVTLNNETYTGSLGGTKNGYGILFINTGAAYPTNVTINNPSINICKVGIIAYPGTASSIINQPTYSGCTTNLTDNSAGGLTINA